MDETVDDISGVPIDTFIVGRKFSDVKYLNLGASISLLRDPDNINDSNAIKVHLLSALLLHNFFFSPFWEKKNLLIPNLILIGFYF